MDSLDGGGRMAGMGHMKDLLAKVCGGGEDALEAVLPLLKAAAVGEWVACSERLPPVLTEVLGWHPDDRVRAWFRISGTVQGGPRQGDYWEMWSPQDRECDDCNVKEPTHWMPLPEPPEVK